MFKNAETMMIEIEFIMAMLGIRDVKRVIQIFRASIDPVAFVRGLCELSKKPQADVLSALEASAVFKPIAASYLFKNAAPAQKAAYHDKRLDITVEPSAYVFKPEQAGLSDDGPIARYLSIMKNSAASVPFAFRDGMDRFTGRFLGRHVTEKDEPDLLDIIGRVRAFLSGMDLAGIKYVITSGIGANEMYSHQLASILNAYLAGEGRSPVWLVVNNPAHIKTIPDLANDGNTIIFEMSRSGGTKETLDFFNATKARFKKRIVAANKGRLKDLAARMQEENGTRVLVIDDTRGDIGGRQMNRKTLMVYVPLFIALAAALKDLDRAGQFLGYYCKRLFDATNELAYKNDNNSAAVRMAEFILRHREAGRLKFSVLHDGSLRYTAKELMQLLNEGGNKAIAGGTNNNILDGYLLDADSSRYEEVFKCDPLRQMPVFLLDINGGNYKKNLAYIEGLTGKGMPCAVVNVELSDDPAANLKVLAGTSALLQDAAVYFTYLTNQDANSNPAVKFVREITAAMFEIVKEKKEGGDPDVRMTFTDVSKKVGRKQEVSRAESKKAIDAKGIVRKPYDRSFDEFRSAIEALAAGLKIEDGELARLLLKAVPLKVILTDIGEAGESKNSDVEEAFSRSAILPLIGELSPMPQAVSLEDRLTVDMQQLRTRISLAVAVPGEFKIDRSRDPAGIIADYLFLMYQARKNGLLYMTLTFMEEELGNPAIGEILKHIIQDLACAGISAPILPLPGVAHSGIEAVMSHPESIFNIAIIYTNTYGGELGGTKIENSITVDDATYIYGIANVIRMALGGSPSVIFEAPDGKALPHIKEVLKEALAQFGEMVKKST